jgi:flavin reductase (DIM6/NTAB) family NADH-FMN oxidoreductase RutF
MPQQQSATTGGSTIADTSDLQGLDPESFKRAFRNHAAGVALVTADDGSGPVALTATSVFSVSADPALFVFSISDMSSSGATLRNADTLIVHILSGEQLDLAKLGAARGVDRFADTSQWSRLLTGEPFFLDCPTWIRGRIVNTLKAGSSTLVVVHALQAGFEADDDVEPLVYYNRTWHRLCEASTIA